VIRGWGKGQRGRQNRLLTHQQWCALRPARGDLGQHQRLRIGPFGERARVRYQIGLDKPGAGLSQLENVRIGTLRRIAVEALRRRGPVALALVLLRRDRSWPGSRRAIARGRYRLSRRHRGIPSPRSGPSTRAEAAFRKFDPMPPRLTSAARTSSPYTWCNRGGELGPRRVAAWKRSAVPR
jgi:hypothetical protein